MTHAVEPGRPAGQPAHPEQPGHRRHHSAVRRPQSPWAISIVRPSSGRHLHRAQREPGPEGVAQRPTGQREGERVGLAHAVGDEAQAAYM